MKKFLQFTGLISLVLAVVAVVLMLATPGIVLTSGNTQYVYKGTVVLFGSKESASIAGLFTLTSETKPSVLALIGFIVILVGIVIVLLGVLLPLLKVKALERFAGVMNLVALCCFVLAGVFMFLAVPTFFAANEVDVPKSAGLGAGWVIGGIVAIAAGAFAILPAAADFMGKKKGKRK